MLLSSKKDVKTKDFAFIDFLRGSAALLVAFVHFYLNTQQFYGNAGWYQTAYPFILGRFDIGKFSIGVFFLVSGFLIPYSLDRSRSIPTFAIHRFLRLYPAYWFSIFFNLTLNYFLAFEPLPHIQTFFANLTMLQGYLRQPDLIGAFWTLQIELTFYIFCVIVFLLHFSNKPHLISYGLMSVSIAFSIFSYFGVHVPMALFIALMLMYCADGLRRQASNTNLVWVLTALSLIPICIFSYRDVAARYILSYWASMIIFRIAHHYQFKFFKKAVYKFFADISYSVYLLHAPIGIQLSRSIAENGGSPLLSYSTAFAATILASWIVFRMLEHPMIMLGKKLSANYASGKSFN